MQGAVSRHPVRALALAAVVGLLGASALPAAAGQPREPFLDVHSAARLAPDGRTLTVDVLASCPLRWSVVEAAVTVSQQQASGRASFPLTCIDQIRSFTVTVPASGGTFALGDAQAHGSVVIRRGKTQLIEDAEVVDVQPAVHVELADTARLESGGAALTIDVTVACPVGATGQATSYVNVTQGQASGAGSYLPICDGSPHTLSVRVPAARGTYQAGSAQALTFADVEHDGFTFSGLDEGAVQIVA